MRNLDNFQTKITPTWCPGCNNFLLLASLKKAFADNNLKKNNTVFSYDIGCIGNMADFVNTYGIHALHGRALPVAVGVKLSNPKLNVFVIVGDGGIYGEGLNHLVAAARANYDVKVIVSNNNLYSLTTGQASPTTPKGTRTKSTPFGLQNEPIDPISFLKTINSKVLALQVDSKKPKDLLNAIDQAVKHKGFALVDVLQDCVSFGKQLKT